VFTPKSDYFAGWTNSAEVASVRLPAGTYLLSAKVTGHGAAIACQLSLDTLGVIDQARVQTPADSRTPLALQSTVVTAGGTVAFACASGNADVVHLDNARMHAIRIVR
jgi:hypothetical protein